MQSPSRSHIPLQNPDTMSCCLSCQPAPAPCPSAAAAELLLLRQAVREGNLPGCTKQGPAACTASLLQHQAAQHTAL